MSDGPSPFSDPPGSNLPDKPLVVKCNYNTRKSKLSFRTARTCTYDGLEEQITKHFQLAGPFTIQWKDDENDWHLIEDEVSLIDAIDFFQSGGGEGSVSSVFAPRSSSRHPKITVLVEICVDLDVLSLSETSSVREGDSPEGSQVSFLPGELSSSSQDDDAVTVSSKDTRAPRGKAKADSSLFKKILNGASRSAGNSSSSKAPLKPSRSRIFNIGSRASSVEEEMTAGSLTDSYPDDHLAVFERLKLEEQRSPPSVHDRTILETDRGKAWLQNQSTIQKAILGVVPSTSDDISSLNDSPFSDVNSDMGISLQRDERGKLYYNLTSFGSSESAGDLEYEVVNGTQPNNATNHLHELLVPEVVTDCSECGIVLDQFKYICTTCGEKTPMSRTALAAAAAAAAGVGKGKSRAPPSHYHHRGNSTEYELQEPSYPPRAHRDPVTPCTSSNTGMPIYSSNSKPLPALPSHSPTQTIFCKSFGSQSTLVPPSSSGSSTPTTRVGYELCHTCFEKVGRDHALPVSVDSPKLPPTPQELAIARRSAPKRKGDLRHAFLFQIWGAGFDGWQDVEQNNTDHCSGCQSQLSGNWYKCGKCDDFTICLACYNEVHNVHPIHPFLVKPPRQSNSRCERPNGDGARMFDNSDEPLKHPGVQCYNCQQDIVGPLFHCVDCTTIDIDICSNCETAGLPGNLDASGGGHNSSHIMLKIPMPLTKPEVQHVSRHAHGLHHGRDHADLRGISPLMRSSPSSVSSISAGTVLYANEDGTEIGHDYVHLEVCNSCGEPIVGIRYQCLNCPSKPNSFNLCSDCELKSYKVHDPMHVFIKIPRPMDYPGPLESEFPIIPVLYKDPAGPAPGSPAAEISGDPEAYLRGLTHTFALCDRHMHRIVGKWYRCAFCAKDLCADCEGLDTHDNTHIFLVFKAPVDMHKFQIFAELETSNGKPVLTNAIYRP
ncbi:hypothetical protein F5888DRAFT_1806331 [Russula emetica]|nr:hypothetical protein F5888DRAFT_1806331 [Russula emetica]